MGQSIQIVRQRTLRSNMVRFEIDRSLTGTSHETYAREPRGEQTRPVDVLASRLFATGRTEAVHVFSNIVTVTTVDDAKVAELEEVLRNLFIHYRPGVLPTAIRARHVEEDSGEF